MLSLRSLPITFRALFSSFLILIGVGYLMALSFMYLVVIEPVPAQKYVWSRNLFTG